MDLIVTKAEELCKAQWGARIFDCAVGRTGFIPAEEKKEGDGKTPIGRWEMKGLFYRTDRLSPPKTAFPTQGIKPSDGWCDDPASPYYNRLISLPFSESHEKMWRADELYDLVVELAHNDSPPIPGRGSAIFLHCAKPGFPATAGCIALKREDLLKVLAQAKPGDAVLVRGD